MKISKADSPYLYNIQYKWFVEILTAIVEELGKVSKALLLEEKIIAIIFKFYKRFLNSFFKICIPIGTYLCLLFLWCENILKTPWHLIY